ncbi:MAG: hypothetical protein ACI9SP_004080 [Arenicella sp.]|jgi:hypothetical protein
MALYESADWDISFLGFSNTGKYKYLGVNQDAVTKVSISDLASGETISMPPLPIGNVRNARFPRMTLSLRSSSMVTPAQVMFIQWAFLPWAFLQQIRAVLARRA